MKYICIAVCVFLTVSSVNSQHVLSFHVSQDEPLQVNLGEDLTVEPGESVFLGENISITGGTGDLVYSWSPSIFLDDNSLQNPVSTPERDVTYILTVIDDNNCMTSDTINIQYTTTSTVDTEISGITIFPNPLDGETMLQIGTGQMTGEAYVRIFSGTGTMVHLGDLHFNKNYSADLYLHFLESGLYILEVTTVHHRTRKKLIVK
jgi:hypothetical protein